MAIIYITLFVIIIPTLPQFILRRAKVQAKPRSSNHSNMNSEPFKPYLKPLSRNGFPDTVYGCLEVVQDDSTPKRPEVLLPLKEVARIALPSQYL
jgi:hypothetical protein